MSRFSKTLRATYRRVTPVLGNRRTFTTTGRKPSSSPSIAEENISRYAPGGFHHVRIGDVFDDGKYKVLRKLGYGVYSTVWLAHDTQAKKNVALKILAADTYDGKCDSFELELLEKISEQASQNKPGGEHVLGLLDDFKHKGPNGQHVCLVLEAMGPDVGQFRDLFAHRRLPLPMAKQATRDMVAALAFLHDACGIIQTDIKPSNILLETPELRNMFIHASPEVFEQDPAGLPPPQDFYIPSEPVISANEDLTTSTEISFRLADFGTSSWTTKHLTEWIQPNMLRAPEVILGGPWDSKVDIWNLGLVIWELVTGQLCFDGQATATADYSSEAHLAQMQSILGRFPEALLSSMHKRDEFFDSNGNLTGSVSFPTYALAAMCASSGVFAVPEELDAFVEFVSGSLILDPKLRPTARELGGARWLKV
ncbi:serine protein kinase sky1 [Ophiostoma piceae UAMH 11346]|uniref:non-specific serine/threonine protein kinase n=1 Tax=Ophiostoma piceae (strain UAMH 11346) TaxID=1262450 RepID=S3CSA3_OPHP1|nr:serine protein kinase sky1 [Ophiostoma piceae UAMH 11346]